MRRLGLAVTIVVSVAAGAPVPAGANGAVQREFQGRVLSADASTGTLVVERTFRGKMTRLSLRAPESVTVFSCAGEALGLERVRVGATVSVFYEVAGSEGIANVVVIEPRQ